MRYFCQNLALINAHVNCPSTLIFELSRFVASASVVVILVFVAYLCFLTLYMFVSSYQGRKCEYFLSKVFLVVTKQSNCRIFYLKRELLIYVIYGWWSQLSPVVYIAIFRSQNSVQKRTGNIRVKKFLSKFSMFDFSGLYCLRTCSKFY